MLINKTFHIKVFGSRRDAEWKSRRPGVCRPAIGDDDWPVVTAGLCRVRSFLDAVNVVKDAAPMSTVGRTGYHTHSSLYGHFFVPFIHLIWAPKVSGVSSQIMRFYGSSFESYF